MIEIVIIDEVANFACFLLIMIEILQILALIVHIQGDTWIIRRSEKVIKSKKDFLIFFIPFFWAIPVLKYIIRYWKNLT